MASVDCSLLVMIARPTQPLLLITAFRALIKPCVAAAAATTITTTTTTTATNTTTTTTTTTTTCCVARCTEPGETISSTAAR